VQLPVKYSRLHDVFPVSLLEKWYSGQDQKLLPLPELVDGEEEWEVEDIVDHKNVGDERRFLVKWAGWPAEYNTWEPREHFANAKKIITAYEQKAYVGIFEGGEYCEEVRWKDPAPSAQHLHRDLGCGIFCFYSVVSLVLFSGRSHIHEDIGCWTFMLLFREKVVAAVFLLSKYTGPEPRELQL
jgi:hypothetical protein